MQPSMESLQEENLITPSFTPDIIIEPSIKSYIDGKDSVLEFILDIGKEH